ncbi:1-deoxy-D-xylulose-5-phosphate reductoisomerase [Candidatus Pelagibacter sp.]|uniref:1-deoxy-D-xylulose-5-phosphate reductoisomerase n=1 Tax=Candidatus Pelagibacter sp. TaxID=2024849 RepID=UPI003F8599A6
MRKKIAILGSTGSIGKTLINIIRKDKKNFEIVLLSAEENYKELLKQAKFFKVKNLILTGRDSYSKLNKNTYSKKINIFNSFEKFDKIFKTKVDYTMSSITGIQGLKPTIDIIKYSKTIAIANKEAIICGWNLIDKNLKKYKTKFIPVDSEHFSIWYALRDIDKNLVDNICITASGGPFLNKPINKLKNVNINQATKHPNWKMGKKISIDSATMINKVYEVIEAKNIFNLHYNQINILTHPKSYVHAIVKFKNGLIKIVAHDTFMKIPIFNTLYSNEFRKINSNKIDIKKLNKLNFNKVNPKRYPMIKLLSLLPKRNSLYETVVVAANDMLVECFLKNKIKFTDIQKDLFKLIKHKEFLKYKKNSPKNIKDIINLNNYIRSKIQKKVYKI